MTQMETTHLELECVVTYDETIEKDGAGQDWLRRENCSVDTVNGIPYKELVNQMGKQGADWLCEMIIEGVM